MLYNILPILFFSLDHWIGKTQRKSQKGIIPKTKKRLIDILTTSTLHGISFLGSTTIANKKSQATLRS